MPTEIMGEYPSIVRKRTGLFSLDLALGDKKVGELGVPLRTIVELYGYPNVGKSTLAYNLSGILSSDGRSVVCDLEMANRDYIRQVYDNSGFNGKVWIVESTIPKKEVVPLSRFDGHKTLKAGDPRYHEEMMTDLTRAMYDEETKTGILDSIGAIQPIGEKSGDFGEAFMGKRAKLVGQVCRELADSLRNKTTPSCVFVINHVHSPLGGNKGRITAGGETLKYLAAIRIMLWPLVTWRLKSDDPESRLLGFQVEGQVEKFRYGERGKKFQFYIVPEEGIHRGATALFDCINYGLVDSKSTLKIGDKSLGRLRKDYLGYALSGKERKFDVFFELLEEYESSLRKEINNESNESKEVDLPDTDTTADVEDIERVDSGAKRRGRKRKGNGG